MSLDKNLFTLLFTPHKDNQNVIDLVDPSGTLHYRKQRAAGSGEYKIEVYDPMSESLLATATAPSATSKVKTIELYNPTILVELKHTGTLSFRWSFKWEDHEFEWKREECFMVRKPDPPVIIAITKEPIGRLKTTSAQILDYNLNRFDIDDRKGLEIVVLTALLTFQDSNEAAHTPEASSSSPTNPMSRAASVFASVASPLNETPPAPPPRPAPKTGVDRVAEMQAVKGEYNEIVISEEGSIQDYAAYCNKLLQDDAMLFISVMSAEAEQVPKVLQVVEETKRIRYKAGLHEEEELHQYVLYDQQEAKKGPRIINLDDERKNKYAPPKNLTVHLSKISMPELQPKAQGNEKISKKDGKAKEDKKAKSSNPSRPAPTIPIAAPSPKPASSTKPSHKLQRPPGSPAGKHHHVSAHQVHPNQPSPSPSQLNNPGIYSAPPLTSSYHSRLPSGATAPSFPQPNVPSYDNGGSSFPPNNWSGQTPPPPPPPVHQPQSYKPNTTTMMVNSLKGFLGSNKIR